MKRLIVFDFDWSLADQDSDHWVLEVLAPHLRRKMEDLTYKVQWTDLVAQCLGDLHSEGFTRSQIEDALRIIPFHPAMVRGLQRLKSVPEPETTFFILSDANIIFIKTIIEAKGIDKLFDEIVTNSAHWEENGLLHLKRRIGPDDPPHHCTVGCSPNICKGEELTAFLARRGTEYEQMCYVGDGGNDFCPALRLRSQDILFCRRGRGLQERIEKEGGIKAQIKYWAGAWEMEEFFNQF